MGIARRKVFEFGILCGPGATVTFRPMTKDDAGLGLASARR